MTSSLLIITSDCLGVGLFHTKKTSSRHLGFGSPPITSRVQISTDGLYYYEHYKELIQDEATAIMKQKQHHELRTQIQKDLDNLAVIDRNNTIVFPLELAGRTYKAGQRDDYLEEILQKRLERRNKVNKLRESVLQHNLDDITEHVKTILDHDKKEEEAFTSQFK